MKTEFTEIQGRDYKKISREKAAKLLKKARKEKKKIHKILGLGYHISENFGGIEAKNLFFRKKHHEFLF